MTNLDPQVQIKLIEISKEWAERKANKEHPGLMINYYPKEFDPIYKELVKTISAG